MGEAGPGGSGEAPEPAPGDALRRARRPAVEFRVDGGGGTGGARGLRCLHRQRVPDRRLAARDPGAALLALANLILGLFNLLPIPPLDGSSLIERVLPREWLPGWYRFRPYGILLLLVVGLSTNLFGRLFSPFIDGLFDFIVR